jgi:hypothetical protein
MIVQGGQNSIWLFNGGVELLSGIVFSRLEEVFLDFSLQPRNQISSMTVAFNSTKALEMLKGVFWIN